MLAALHCVVFQVEFSLLLAFLVPLEGSAVEKVPGMFLFDIPKQQTCMKCTYCMWGGFWLCSRAVLEKILPLYCVR